MLLFWVRVFLWFKPLSSLHRECWYPRHITVSNCEPFFYCNFERNTWAEGYRVDMILRYFYLPRRGLSKEWVNDVRHPCNRGCKLICIFYMSHVLTVIKHHDQGNSQTQGLLWTWSSRGIKVPDARAEVAGAKTKAAGTSWAISRKQREGTQRNRSSSGATLPKLPQQHHSLGNTVSNAGDYWENTVSNAGDYWEHLVQTTTTRVTHFSLFLWS